MGSLPHSPFSLQTPKIVEQRLFLRKKLLKPLPIELLPGKEVWLDDLGEGGLGVSGSSRLEVGSTTSLTFQFPEANSVIEAAGVVVWCDQSGRVGVRFTRIKQDSTAALKRWLKEGVGSGATDSSIAQQNASDAAPRVPRANFEIAALKEEVEAARRNNASELDVVVERMLRLTRATGAAIALRDGLTIVCRASAGNAPSVGVELDVRSGVSGECYRSGNIVSVSDSETDSRVNPQICRELDFRSLMIVPVTVGNEVVGIGEVFSPLPGNFDGGDVLLLSAMTELIAEVFQRERTINCANPEPGNLEPAENEHHGPEGRPDISGAGPNWKTTFRTLALVLGVIGIGVGSYFRWPVRVASQKRNQAPELRVLSPAPALTPVALAVVPAEPAKSTSTPAVHVHANSETSELNSISKRVVPGKLVHRVAPVLPDFAKEGDINGPLVLSATIGKDGRVRNVKLVSGPPALAVDAFHALREWRYTPYMVDGQAVEAQTRIVLNFDR